MTELSASKPSLKELLTGSTLEYGSSKMDFSVLRNWLAGYNNCLGTFFGNIHNFSPSAPLESLIILNGVTVSIQHHQDIAEFSAGLRQKLEDARTLALPSLSTYFSRMAKIFLNQKELLIQLLVAFLGKTYRQASVEVEQAIKVWQFGYMNPEDTPSTITKVDKTVTWLTGPYRSPLLELSLAVRQKLSQGNLVVLTGDMKYHPLLICFASLCAEANLPPGFVNAIMLDRSSLISKKNQQSIAQLLGARRTQISYKTNALDCFVVYDSGDLDCALESLISYAKLNNTEAGMSACGLVQASVWEQFVQLLKARFAKLATGDGLDRNVDISSSQERALALRVKLEAQIAPTGIEVLSPGNNDFALPKVIVGAEPAHELLKDEYCPLLVIYPFRTHKESLTLINTLSAIATASIFSENLSLAMSVATQIKARSVCLNGYGYPYEGMELNDEITYEISDSEVDADRVQAEGLTKDLFKVIDGLKTGQKSWASQSRRMRSTIFRDAIATVEQKMAPLTTEDVKAPVSCWKILLKDYQQEGTILSSAEFKGTILQSRQPRGAILLVVSKMESSFKTIFHTVVQCLLEGNSLLVIPTGKDEKVIVEALVSHFVECKLPANLVRVLNLESSKTEQHVVNLLARGDLAAFISIGNQYELFSASGCVAGQRIPTYIQNGKNVLSGATMLEKLVGNFKYTFIPSGDSFGN